MSGGIRAEERKDWGQHAYETGAADAAPATAIGECGEDFLCISGLAEEPDCDEDAEEAAVVEYQDDAFDKRELVCEEGVEELAKGDDGYDVEDQVPALRGVFLIVQNLESLDLLCGRWCKFTDPIILSAGSRGPRKPSILRAEEGI